MKKAESGGSFEHDPGSGRGWQGGALAKKAKLNTQCEVPRRLRQLAEVV